MFLSGRLEQKSQFSEGKERKRDSGKSVTSFVLGWGCWNVPKHFGLSSSLLDEQGACRALGEGIHASWYLFQDLVKGLRVKFKQLLGFSGGSDGKESACKEGDLGSISGSGRSPGGGHGNPLQDSCLENPHRQRNLVGYSPRGHKESDTTERLSTAHSTELPEGCLV